MCSIRLMIGFQMFFACIIVGIVRVNLSVSIVAMVLRKPSFKTSECGTVNETVSNLNPDYGERFNWDNDIQGYILGGYFWGFVLSCAIGGYLAEAFSATIVVTISMLLSGILTALNPIFCQMHWAGLMAIRIGIGFAGGVVFPCLQTMLANWIPPEEKSKYMSAIMGSTFGTIITFSCGGKLIKALGWVWSFYIPAIIAVVQSIIWFLLVTDSPDSHKKISETEREFINKSIGDKISHKKRKIPYGEILKSGPVWALNILHTGNTWGLFFILTVAPKFSSEMLHFDIKSAGMVSSLPLLARFVSGFLFGSVCDLLRRKTNISTTFIRKFFCIFSHIIPGILLGCLIFIGCKHSMWIVTLLTASLGFNGATQVTSLQNTQDLAPNFAGSVFGVMNTFGSLSGILSPMTVGLLTKKKQDLHSWHICFLMGSAIYILTAIIFLLFGTGEEQQWNKDQPSSE